jgi:sugar (pentulose or hexulose) kinase
MAEEGTWGLEMDLLATGSSLCWLAVVLLGSPSPLALGELASNVAPVDAPVFLPYLGGGEQGALWDPTLRGSVVGLDLRHDRGHLARGLLNGIVLESRRCLAVLEEAGLPASTIHLAGGSATVPGFARDLADATRRRVSKPPDGETYSSAAGAAKLVAHAIKGGPTNRAHEALTGGTPTDDDLTHDVVEPDKERALVWDRLFARHDRALAALRCFREDGPEGEGQAL